MLFPLSLSILILHVLFPHFCPSSPSLSTYAQLPIILVILCSHSFPLTFATSYNYPTLTHTQLSGKSVFLVSFSAPIYLYTVSFVTQIPVAFVPAISPETGCNEFGQSWGEELFFSYATLTLYIIPLMVIIPCYTKIAQRMTKKTPGSTLSNDSNRLARRKKTIIWIFVVVVLFTLMWLPIHVVHLWMAFDPTVTAQTPLYIELHTAANVFMFINSSVNPYLYTFILAPFRKHLKEIAKCCCCGVVWLRKRKEQNKNMSESVTSLSSRKLSHTSISQDSTKPV